MARIELKNISKVFPGGIQAVDGISLAIEDGEFVVLVGPSGCGKTTILRMIAGLETSTSGEIFFDKMLVNELEPAARNVGMVFQEYALYPHLSVFENIAFPLNVHRKKWTAKNKSEKQLSKIEIKNRVSEIIEHLKLTDLVSRKPRELSGGQRQRVALGRALVRKPTLFLFDEPLSNLDAKLRITLRQEIINLHKKFGVTSIYVTHDQTEAMTMGSKIAILKDGILQQLATPMEIYSNPINLFVADFIGSPSISIFEGSVQNGVFQETNSDVTINLKKHYSNKVVNLDKIKYIAIRPEMLEVGKSDSENRINITFIVDNFEFIGNESIIYFTTGNRQKRIICPPTQYIQYQSKSNCHFAIDSLLFFDVDGNRVYFS